MGADFQYANMHGVLGVALFFGARGLGSLAAARFSSATVGCGVCIFGGGARMVGADARYDTQELSDTVDERQNNPPHICMENKQSSISLLLWNRIKT